jgi:hypothetical protein
MAAQAPAAGKRRASAQQGSQAAARLGRMGRTGAGGGAAWGSRANRHGRGGPARVAAAGGGTYGRQPVAHGGTARLYSPSGKARAVGDGTRGLGLRDEKELSNSWASVDCWTICQV